METNEKLTEKLLQLVDRLLVKTQDNLCDWKKVTNEKYNLRLAAANLYIELHQVVGGTDYITLDIVRDDVTIATLKGNRKDNENNLVRLFNTALEYHQDYVDKHITKLMEEIQKLGDQPF